MNALNVCDFGADPTGASDSSPGIQSCFDEAFGPRDNPHGNDGRWKNRPVYFPSGQYRCWSPLYLTGIDGGRIFGDACNAVWICYVGPPSGNDCTPPGALGDTTPLLMINGLARSSISNLSFQGTNDNGVGVWLWWDGKQWPGPTLNTWTQIGVSALTGFLIGWEAPGLCSEQMFISCTAGNCAFSGFRNISHNALNNWFIGCGASECGRGFSCPTGSIHIIGASLANNGVDIETGSDPTVILGSRTESANFVTCTSGGPPVHISGCLQTGGFPGHFVDAGINSIVIDACTVPVTNDPACGLILGQADSRIYLRGNDIRNPRLLDQYGGKVVEWSAAPHPFANLPAALPCLEGLRRVITDASGGQVRGKKPPPSTASTNEIFGAPASGGGSRILPVFCDGEAWNFG